MTRALSRLAAGHGRINGARTLPLVARLHHNLLVAIREAFVNGFHQLFEPLPPLEGLVAGGWRLAMFCGERDPYRRNVERAARSLEARFATTRGDRVGAFFSAEARAFVLSCLCGGGHRARDRSG